MRRALLLAFALFITVAGAAHTAVGPSPGSSGLGDRLFPELGNGGYDALHYDVALRYATSAPTQPIDGTVTMVARATQALSRFDLDFAGASVGAVAVNGQQASFARWGGARDHAAPAWVKRYRGQAASTDDFIALASQVSGRNLTDFLRDWLYGTKTPRMPGHPNWKVDPVAGNLAPARTARGRG